MYMLLVTVQKGKVQMWTWSSQLPTLMNSILDINGSHIMVFSGIDSEEE